MKTKSIGFGEAVRTLAAEAGMQPYRFLIMTKERFKISNLQKYFKNYSDYFHRQLLNSNNKEAMNTLQREI